MLTWSALVFLVGGRGSWAGGVVTKHGEHIQFKELGPNTSGLECRWVHLGMEGLFFQFGVVDQLMSWVWGMVSWR